MQQSCTLSSSHFAEERSESQEYIQGCETQWLRWGPLHFTASLSHLRVSKGTTEAQRGWRFGQGHTASEQQLPNGMPVVFCTNGLHPRVTSHSPDQRPHQLAGVRVEKLRGGLARYGRLVAWGQNKTGSVRLALETPCKPKAPKRDVKDGMLWVGNSESTMRWLLTLLIGCDIT